MLEMKCECGWTGTLSAAVPDGNDYLCPVCKLKVSPVDAEETPPEELTDIEGATNMELDHGERFRGYYLFKKPLRAELLPLGRSDLSYHFNICNFEVRFLMPPKLEFSGGIVSYSVAEREMGIFRFPRHPDGTFSTPLTSFKKTEELNNLSEEDLKKLLQAPSPLVFEAFRIPKYGFNYMDLSPANFAEIEMLTDAEFASKLKQEYDEKMSQLMREIRDKITFGCNFLLILQNTLDRYWKNLEEVSVATGKIIHI